MLQIIPLIMLCFLPGYLCGIITRVYLILHLMEELPYLAFMTNLNQPIKEGEWFIDENGNKVKMTKNEEGDEEFEIEESIFYFYFVSLRKY